MNYSIKLTTSSRKFLNEVFTSGISRKDISSVIISKIIAYTLPMPSGEVKDILDNYNMMAKPVASGYIDKINDIMPIDITKVEELIRDFFLLRYNSIYPNTLKVINNKDNTPFDNFMGYTKFISRKTIDTVSSEKFFLYHNGYVDLLKEIFGEDDNG